VFQLAEMAGDREAGSMKPSISKLSPACRCLDDSMPQLKYFAASFWWSWNFTCYGGFGWESNPFLNAAALAAFNNLSTASLIAAALFLALFPHARKLLMSDVTLLLGGLAGSAGTLLLVLLGGYLPYADGLLYLAGVFTGAASGILAMKIAMYYGTMAPRDSLKAALAAALATPLIYFVTTGSPKEFGLPLFVALFLASALLLVAGNHASVPASKDVSQYLEPLPAMWRLLVLVALSFFISEFMRFAYAGAYSISELLQVNATTAALLIVIFLACLGAISLYRKPIGLGRIYYPFTIIMLALFTLALIGSSANPVFVCVSNTCNFILQTQIFAVFALISFSSKSSPLKVFGFGFCLIGAGSVAGSLLGSYLEALPGNEVFRVLFGAIMLLCFVLLLALVFPPRQAAKLLVELPDEEIGTSDANAGRKAPGSEGGRGKPWRQRAAEVGVRFGLSPREQEIFELLAKGHGINHVSEKLTISVYTTRAHTRNIYAKTGVHTREALIELVDAAEQQQI
jgi:DNA-binding CsgD family transcriptional regulator